MFEDAPLTDCEMSGPMVEPHGQSFLTMNSCTVSPASRASSRTCKRARG